MLPLGLLNAAQGHPMLVELKTGETLNGHLANCDTYMNLTLKEVVQTSPEGDKFLRLAECYVRGNNIKYLRVPDEVVDAIQHQRSHRESQREAMEEKAAGQLRAAVQLREKYGGGRGDRGRGRGRGGPGRWTARGGRGG